MKTRSYGYGPTNAHLRVAFDVVESLGFQYKTLLTWTKDRMGTGEWLRGQTEHCLLAIRGRPAFVNGNHATVLRPRDASTRGNRRRSMTSLKPSAQGNE